MATSGARGIEGKLDEAGIRSPRPLYGGGVTAWLLLDYALIRGYDAGIGLEDTWTLPDAQLARDNAQLAAAR